MRFSGRGAFAVTWPFVGENTSPHFGLIAYVRLRFSKIFVILDGAHVIRGWT